MPYDLILKNARIITPQGERFGDLGITAGRIAAIGEIAAPATRTIDATGLIVLPGGIDTHCHIAQRPIHGEQPSPDDFQTATAAAAAGGTTTVIAHSMCPRGGNPADYLADYLAQAETNALIDYGVHLQMPDANPRFLAETLPQLAAQGFTSLKIFTTYDGYSLTDAEMLAVMQAAAPLGLLILIHAEDDALIRHLTARAVAEGRTSLQDQPTTRPIAAEAGMINRVAGYAKATGARVHIFHVTGTEAINELTRARATGTSITGETCTHYLSFTSADLARPSHQGAMYLSTPPLRSQTDQDDLWAALADRRLHTVSSDHSPSHRRAQIARAEAGEPMPFTAFSGGTPGLQALLPVLFSQGVSTGRLTLARFAELTATAPARLFGIPAKGTIEPGRDADLTLWDPDERWVMRHRDMHSRVDFTPWDGMAMTGRPVMTISRGRIIAQNGQSDRAAAGHGQLVRRQGGPLWPNG